MGSVTVRYFAVLREKRGTDEEAVALREGETVAALYARLFAEPRVPVAFARNHARVGADEPLVDGDEVAFLPPLGGG